MFRPCRWRTSRLSPHPVVVPSLRIGSVDGYHRDVGRAGNHYVYRPTSLRNSEDEATRASRVVRIVLDDLRRTTNDSTFNIRNGYPLRSRLAEAVEGQAVLAAAHSRTNRLKEVASPGHASASAATPGSSRPSRNSSEAPPPVLTWENRSAIPSCSTTAAVSPPPTMVVAPSRLAMTAASRCDPWAKGANSITPMGPFQTTVRHPANP